MTNKNLHCFVYGRVQGVGFRKWIKTKSLEYSFILNEKLKLNYDHGQQHDAPGEHFIRDPVGICVFVKLVILI